MRMSITTFGAIYIGSYEVSLKVFELSARKKIRSIDHVRKRVELGKDAYTRGVVGYELVEELCQVLKEFSQIMEVYQVDDYQAYASMVLREVSNELFILDQIRLRTGIQVQILSNSEQRFISYKSLSVDQNFDKMIQEGAAVADVGGGSMQITLFYQGKVLTTQHIVLGTVRIREKMTEIESMASHYEMQIQELVDKELEIFRNLYLKGQKIKYVILVGDYIFEIMKQIKRRSDDTFEVERLFKALHKLEKKNIEHIAEELHILSEQDPLILPSVILYRRLAEQLNADYVWIPGVDISDGMANDYAQNNRITKVSHDFSEDILSASRNLAERYKGFSKHSEGMVQVSNCIFDAMKKVHGMQTRERLLLQVAAILHDCGRYISLANQSECSYHIIMSSEIIGMTHLEREIVASTVKYNTQPLSPYEEVVNKMDQHSYMIVAKLSAILKIANAMDRSHKQKYKNIKAALHDNSQKEKQLVITVDCKENTNLEKGLFTAYADSFEKIFSIRPVIKEKRVVT
jgi:exopolyphosphatase/guanosine-5'-triphosphate,3'-diphosphate pyrophosphatase